MMRQTVSDLLLVTGLALMAGPSCGNMCNPDTDNEQPKALRISPGILVKDSIASDCDSIDWKDFSYFQDAKGTVSFVFGEAYKTHSVRGEISLFSFDGQLMERQPVLPEKREYVFHFNATKDKDFFFKLQAFKGHSGYMVETKTESLDPCAQCTGGTTCCPPTNLCCGPGTVCKEGACVRADQCIPSCDREDVCVSGRCEPACSPPCRGGKRCDVEARRCVAVGTTPVTHTEPKKKGCPPCKSGETCNPDTDKCEPVPTGISASVLGVMDEGGTTIILLNRGTQDGVKRGAGGRIGGFTFTIREATATKSKAKVNGAKPEQLKGLGKVSISK